MQPGLSLDQARELLDKYPEQPAFDWKRDFTDPRSDDEKGEFVKDVVAVANATGFSHGTGYILCGVDPRTPERFLGISGSSDDARLQQLMASCVDPPVTFLYYEVLVDATTRIAVVEVPRSRAPFHVIKRDIGKLRKGQVLIREGSHTRGIQPIELRRLYLDPRNGWMDQVLKGYELQLQQQDLALRQDAAARARIQELRRDLERFSGLPPGVLTDLPSE